MKKLTLLIAALVLTFTAQATIINGTPNPGEFGRLRYWVHTVANAGDTIVLADGTYEEKSVIDFTEAGIVVMAAEGAKPVVKTVGQWMVMNIKASTTFEGITFDSESSEDNDMYGFKLSADAEFKNCTFQDYANACIQVDENVVVNKLVIEDCVFDGANTTPVAIYARGIIEDCAIEGTEFKNYTEYCIYANDYYGARFDKLTIDKCLFHDCTYSAVYLAKAKDGLEKQSCSDFTLTNSTIYNVGNDPEGDDVPQRAVVEIRKNSSVASEQKVLIDYITIYNFPAPAHCGAFKVDQTNNTTISNCIAMNPDNIYSKWINPFVISAGATISNSVYFNCGYIDNGATQSNLVKADPMFVDAANGDFMLYAESPAVGMGDPRWGVKAGLQPGSGKLKAAVNAAQAGATIELGDGIYEEPSSIDFNKEGLTIKAAEGTNPVVKASSYLKHNATTTFIGITFDGQDVAEYTTYSYKTDTEKDLTFINCEFKNYTKSCVTIGDGEANVRNLLVDGCTFDGGSKTPAAIKSSGIISACDIKDSEIKGYTEYGFVANSSSAHTEELSIDNTLIHDCGASAIYVTAAANGKDKQSCSSFELTNSTIYNIGNNTKDHGAVDIRDNANITSAQQVLIDHVTLYNFNTKDWYGGFMIYQSATATISNCIVSNPADLSGKNGYHVYGNAVVTNSLYNNCNITSGAQQTANIKADPLFVDAANANFMLSANSPAVGKGTDGSNLGDTRWGVSAKVLGKRINVTPDQASSLPWMIQSDESNVKAGDTIVLAAGTYELSSFELRKEGLVIMAAENAEVKIATKEGEYLQIVATTTFDGITFDGSNGANYAIRSIGTSAKNLIVHNCKFTQYARYNIYGAVGTHLDSLIVDNCIFSNSGAAIYFPALNLADNVPGCSYAKITNSTLYNIILNDYVASIDIQENNNAEQTGNTEVVIDHVTIYNFSSTAQAAIKVYKSGNTKVTNTIVANPAESEMKSFMIYEGAKVQNCLNFNSVGQWASNAYTDTICTDPLFVDAANNNFKLKGNSPAIGKATDGSNLGDPRWGVEAIVIGEGDNTAALATQGTALVQVNREFSADKLYTLALPFTLTDVVSIFGQGTIVYEYDKLLEQNGDVVLHFKEVNTISAGKPYLLKPKQDVNGFVVNNVTLSNSAQTLSFTVGTTTIAMEPVLSVTSDQTTDGKYWLASDTYLYNNTNALQSLRALFTISTPSGIAPRARVALGENVETGLDNKQLPNTNIQKVLKNGQLIIIRDGVKYNVQGQKL